MTETQRLIRELKKQLKGHGIQYQDIAAALGLSEGSVKRLLAEGSQISLERLSAICQLIGLEMGELFKLASQAEKGLDALSFEQEKQLVANKGLLLVAVCVVNGYRFEEILSQYQFSEPELIQQLVALDKLGVIELLPANRIKMKISPDFRWVPGGPIQCFFQQQVQNEFFHSYFSADDEKLVMSSGLMSLPSNHKLQHKIQKLVDEFYAGCKADEVLDLNDRHGTSMVIGLRRWTFPLFDDLLRTPKS